MSQEHVPVSEDGEEFRHSTDVPMLTPEQAKARDDAIEEVYRNLGRLLDVSPHTAVFTDTAIDSDFASHGTKDGEDFHDNMTTLERSCYVQGTDNILYKVTSKENPRTYPNIRVDYIRPNSSSNPGSHVELEYLEFSTTSSTKKAQRITLFHENRNTITTGASPLQTDELDGLLVNLLQPIFIDEKELPASSVRKRIEAKSEPKPRLRGKGVKHFIRTLLDKNDLSGDEL